MSAINNHFVRCSLTSGSLTEANSTAEQLPSESPSSRVPSMIGANNAASAITIPTITRRKSIPHSSTRCMVSNCNLILTKQYNKRCRLCINHMTSAELHLDGTIQRFCQKCGKPHLLQEFEGLKRSCRVALERHNALQKARRSLRAQCTSPSSDGSLSAADPSSDQASDDETAKPGQSPSINSGGYPMSVLNSAHLIQGRVLSDSLCAQWVPQESPIAATVVPTPSQTEQRLEDLNFEQFMLSNKESDQLVDWLVSGQEYPEISQQHGSTGVMHKSYVAQRCGSLSPTFQLPSDFFD